MLMAQPSLLRLTLVFLGLTALATTFAFIPTAYSIPLIGLLALIIVTWGFKYTLLYIGLFLIPAVGITLDLSSFPFLRSLPIIGTWNAPIGDFIILALVIVYGTYMMHYERKKHIYHHLKEHLPGIAWYGPFLVLAALTIFRAPRELQISSANYYLRFVVFPYVGYAALLYWMVKHKDHLKNIVHVLAWSGIVSATVSVWSLFVNEPFWGVWRRITPFAWGQWLPFGHNHNQLSEWLVVTIPLTILLSSKKDAWRKWYGWTAMLMIVVTLFTFGRTAWITLIIQALAAWWMLRPEKITQHIIRAWPLGVVVLTMVAYMGVFSSSAYVAASTQARLDLTKFALLQAAQTPVLGHGIGTFMVAVGTSRAFVLQYGDPIEAHGFPQKLLFETGLLGTALFSVFLLWLLFNLAREYHNAHESDYKHLVCAAHSALLGAVCFQLFNTSYFNAKLWLPVGLALVVLYGKWKFNVKS